MDYVKIINNGKDIEYAENGIILSEKIVFNPSEDEILAAGYHVFANNLPEYKEGYVSETDYYELRDDSKVYVVYKYTKIPELVEPV